MKITDEKNFDRRKKIEKYLEFVERRNRRKSSLQWLLIATFMCLLMLLASGNILLLVVSSLLAAMILYQLYARPATSERDIDKWMKDDREKLREKAIEKLGTSGELFSSEIPLWVGIDKRFLKVLEDVDIDKNNFFAEKGFDGKKRFGVYQFVTIFLCQSFLAYYKCYWNFVKGASINDEFSEYLYVSITSVKYNEVSSSKEDDLFSSKDNKDDEEDKSKPEEEDGTSPDTSNKNNPIPSKEAIKPKINKKIIYSEFSISTEGSGGVTFRINRSNAEVGYSLEPHISEHKERSEAEIAVRLIREQIRKRRPDYQDVRMLESDFS